MLISEMKPREELSPLCRDKVFLLMCRGCAEVSFPAAEAEALRREFAESGKLTGSLDTDHICERESLLARMESRAAALSAADSVLVLSCGVGVQTAAALWPEKRVCAGCNTLRLPGFALVTPSEADCAQCGQCYLNLTGGICPVTACSKSLLNGPCGGAKNGKCEADADMDCGWERIFARMEALGRGGELRGGVRLRDHSLRAESREMKKEGGESA